MEKALDYTVSQHATLLDAVQRINRNHSRAVMIVEEQKVIGVISEGDIMRALLQGVDIHAPLAPFAQPGFKFLNEKDLAKALEIFTRHGITMLPVVDEEFHIKDIVTLREVLERALLGSGDL